MFGNIEFGYVMKKMLRFKDNDLISILEKMRTRGGVRLSKKECAALTATAWKPDKDAASVGAVESNWYHSSFLWSIVSMAAYVQAKASAVEAKKTLYYVQAVDVATPSTRDKKIYKEMLEVPSMTKTGRLPSFVLFHLGMRVKLTQNIMPPWAVQDVAGTVVDYELSNHDSKHGAANEILLRHLPKAIFVKLDDCTEEFLPRTQCDRHGEYCDACPDCQKHPGVIMVRPKKQSWHFESKDQPGIKKKVQRTQICLMPVATCSLYSLQGTTAEPGLVAHFTLPTRLGNAMKWLIVYVLLSRVPSLAQLRSIGLDNKVRSIIENGPPEALLDAFDQLCAQKDAYTKTTCVTARAALGW